MKMREVSTLMLAVLLVACGGGGGDSSTAGINGGGVSGINGGGVQGINGGGVAVGPITGFGSVFVNGIEFATTSTSITVEGAAANEAALKIGQLVEVRGTLNSTTNTGTATSIAASDQLEGPVQAIDLAGLNFTLLGNVVRVTGTTVFDDRFATPSLGGLIVGQWVEVSGLRNSVGEVVATRVEPRAANGEIELNGTVTLLDTGARTFRLANTPINYAAAAVSGTLANNVCAEVKGNTFTGTTLNATRVEVKNCALTVANNDVGKIEGFVTRFASAADFDVGAQRATTTATTSYVGGVAADLVLNKRIEIEGTFNASGVLVGSKIQFKADTSTRFEGVIDALDAANRTLRIFGVTVSTSTTTSYDDNSAVRARPFGFAQLRTGDYVEIRGAEGTAPLTAAATLIERDDLDSRRELQSTARNVASPNFTLVGVNVTTTNSTQFRDLNDNPLTQAQFFSQISGRGVKVRGNWNGASFSATEAELENLN
jgi:hypothetical protein